MAFLFYFIVLLISAGGVMFGLDLITSPLPNMPESVHIGRPTPLPPQRAKREPGGKTREKTRVVDRALSPIYPASPGPSAKVIARAEAVPAPDSDQAPAPAQTDGFADAQPDVAPAQSSCDAQACAAAYRSFSAADCTYLPRIGPRRLCTKSSGTAQVAATPPPAQSRQARAAPLRLTSKVATRGPERRNKARWVTRQMPQRRGLFTQNRNEDASEVARIVTQMTRGRAMGDFAVRRADGSISIVHTGDARAQYR